MIRVEGRRKLSSAYFVKEEKTEDPIEAGGKIRCACGRKVQAEMAGGLYMEYQSTFNSTCSISWLCQAKDHSSKQQLAPASCRRDSGGKL